MKTAEIVKIKIEKLDDDLSGVAFRGGKKYVVAKTLPDEEVLCEGVAYPTLRVKQINVTRCRTV